MTRPTRLCGLCHEYARNRSWRNVAAQQAQLGSCVPTMFRSRPLPLPYHEIRRSINMLTRGFWSKRPSANRTVKLLFFRSDYHLG